MVVDRLGAVELWAEGCTGQPAVRRTTHRGVALASLPKHRLQGVVAIDLVAGEARAGRPPDHIRPSALGRDENDARAGTRTVDGACRRAFEDLDRLYVVRIEIHHAIGRGGSSRGERRHDLRVVHRNAVDDEERLRRSLDRLLPANLNEAGRTGLARGRRHEHAGSLCGERLDDI